MQLKLLVFICVSTLITANKRIILIGGQKAEWSYIRTLEEYNPNTKSSKLLPVNLIWPRGEHISAVLDNGEILVAGGSTSQGIVTNSTEIINLEKKSVRSGPPMLVRRRYAGAALFNGGVWVCGGSNSGDLRACEVYKGGKWSMAPHMGWWRKLNVLVAIKSRNELYAIGGDYYGRVEVYKPETGKWVDVAPLKNLISLGAAEVDGVIHACGGRERGTTQALNACLRYIPSENRWVNDVSMMQGRQYFPMIAFDGILFSFGGDRGKQAQNGGMKSIECNDLKKNKWTSCGEMQEARYFHTAVVVTEM